MLNLNLILGWSVIKCHYIGYKDGSNTYPAYCIKHGVDGVDEHGDYTVDLTKILDDEKIYRVIINGFPYKTASQLGLENDYDAYMATKQAVNCVMLNRNVRNLYRGTNSAGNKIVDVIESLTNIGRNGTQKFEDANLKVQKSGSLVEEGNYYTQRFKVTSDVNISGYNVISTANLPSGAYVANTSNSATTSFSGSEDFKIVIPKSSMNEDLNAVINVRAKCKTFPVFYGKTTVSGTQNYAVTTDPYGSYAQRANLNVTVNTGKIQVTKVDSETNKPISGVTFALYKKDGTYVASATTNAEGIASFGSLYQGDYVLKETSTNENYVLNTDSFDVTVEYNKTATKTITNEHKKGNLAVFKVDKDNHRVALGNVNFDLYSEEFQEVIGTFVTNTDGEIKINNLRTGKYKLIEKNTGKWYNLADDTQVEIFWNETTNSTIENELKKGQVKVIKVDLDNNQVKIPNVKFEVLDKNGNVLEKITTNQNGEALTKRYPIRDYESITLHEIETDTWYVLNDEPQTVTLEENQIKNITFTNEKKKGQIRVIKVDTDNNEVLLEGVTFDILDESGKVVDTVVTNSNSEALTKRLPIDQKYTVREKETLNNYVLTEETQTVELKHDEIKNITFQNEKKKGQIRIIKVDLDNNEVLLEGVTFEILDSKGNVVDTVVTNENGEATSIRVPIDDTYTIREKETLTEYVLNEETKTVVLQENEIKSIQFENEKIKGYVEVTKVDNKTRETLKDATFGIYDLDNNLIEQITTDETGTAKSNLIPYGKYYVKELDTGSVYYLLNENTYEFEITENHVTIPLTIENEGVDIEVTVEKTGTVEIKPGEKVNYEFSDVGNASNTYLENFKWFDYIPTDYIRLQNMTTGTWNQDLTYSVYYKTNKSDEYILFKETLSTNENYTLDFTEIQFTDDEYIVETCFDFGKVDIGFKEDAKPTMECKSFDTLKDKDTFTNYTKTVGVYFGITAEANSKWTTITHIPEKPKKVLPRTGR